MEKVARIYNHFIRNLGNNSVSSQKFLGKTYYQFLFFILLFIVIFVVWRMNFSFFFMDEWDWLKDLADGNFSIWAPHNEHFLPIMRVFYLLQISIFNADPLMMHYVILVLHTIVSFLFSYFLWLLFRENILSIAGSIGFLLHPFQGENVLWTFQSQIILNVGFFLLSLISIKLFFNKGCKRYFYLSLLFTFIQAYCFGNGLILPLVIIAFFLLFKDKKYSLKYYLPYVAIFILNLVIYKLFGSQKITSHTGPFSIVNFPSILDYFANAILFNIVRSLTSIGTPRFDIAWVFYVIFFTVFICVLILDLGNRRKFYRKLLFGLFFYFICFVLISITRFKLGFGQSFSPRYAYYYLIPIILLCLSFVRYLFSTFAYKKAYQVLVISSTLVFSILATYRILGQKRGVELRNKHNYQELTQYHLDTTYDPDFSLLHPYLTKDEVLQTSRKLNLIDVEVPG